MKMKQIKITGTVWAGKTCICYETVGSTQDEGKKLAQEKPVHGTLLYAEEQISGKGRRGRIWESSKGKNIAMSLCLEPEFPPEYAAGLTLVMALASAKAMEEQTGQCPQIKWPNDIVMNGKKICGILTELCMKPEGYAVVIGVGINVNTDTFSEEIRSIASSLKIETGRTVSREALIVSILKFFEFYYEKYEKEKSFSQLREAYEALLANKDREVQVLDPKGSYSGIAKGINEQGHLHVVKNDGKECFVDSGEVSVRGIYGYV